LALVDAAIAERITTWGPLPEYRLIESLDLWVDSIDPGAVRRTRQIRPRPRRHHRRRPAHPAQRRADALGALAAGAQHLSCMCEHPGCPAKLDDGRATSITVHVITEQSSTQPQRDPQLHGDELGTPHWPRSRKQSHARRPH
jgi:hypothetical protein